MIAIISHSKVHSMLNDDACPYQHSNNNNCAASISAMALSIGKKEKFCRTENYDNCPVFLSKVLRRR